MKKRIISIIALLTMTTAVMAQRQETFKVKNVSFSMVKVEGGKFTMGYTSDQSKENSYIKSHQENVATFFIGQTEVTQELWEAVMGYNPSVFKGSNLPVENVSWKECQEFIKKLNKLTGKKFRLPSHAEWEYAARGGKQDKPSQFAGSNNIEDVGWYAQNSGNSRLSDNWRREELRNNGCKTHKVASKMPNELGLYDMSGNVAEYCQDKYDGNNRVTKGGSFNHVKDQCTVCEIGCLPPNDKWENIGLRLALSE